MSASFRRPPSFASPSQAGPATRALVILLLVASVVAAFCQRSVGWGTYELLYDRDAIMAGELWRLVTYAFVKVASPLALLLSAAALWLFGSSFEQRWGSRGFVQFFLSSTIGAAILAVPLGLLCNATGLFVDRGVFGGPDAAIDAMLVALALGAPNSQVLFGFVLPVQARTFVLALLGLELLGGIMTGVASMGLTLGGMGMGYVLVTGIWRPSLARDKFRLWQLNRRRRRGLFVVPPKRRGPFN